MMAKDTRGQFLDTAEALFAERGFYGVSIAAIADELGLTKQALLHHFGTKEKLYGDVLARISARFEALDGAVAARDASPSERLIAFFVKLYDISHAPQTRLLMRELLDNKQRADSAATWYLKPFLERLIGMVQAVPHWHDADDAQALALVYQWLGAVNYFAVSQPTLIGIFGDDKHAAIADAFPALLQNLIEAGLQAHPLGTVAAKKDNQHAL